MTLLRSALFNVVFFGLTFLFVLPATVIRFVAPHRVLDIARLWARTMCASVRLICGIRFEVSGLEHIPRGPALIASAHQSAFDTMIWLLLVPRACYVLKRELRAIPLFGALTQASGMITVDRQAGASAVRGLLREGDRAVREGRQIIIFPEGTRSDPDAMLPLQPGIAALASRTGLPVIPVATDSGRYWGRRSFVKQPGTIRVVIRPPLGPGLRRDELMRQLAEAMRLGDEPRA
jgi:1-acyl-sn-glycerol-3-phosphate acyltransferase